MIRSKMGLQTALLGVLVSVSAMSPSLVAAAEVREIEEIVVTAQKREQNLQDVSISITAFDGDALAKAGIKDVSRMYLVTPGMNYGFYSSDAKIAIRGAHSNNTYGDNQSIAGFYIDGVYRARPSQQSQGYFDVDRIEVLKGPQGTLYGRNTFAGAINLYTRKPHTESMEFGIEAGAADYGTFTTEGFVNVPVGENLAVRVAFSTKDSDGYIDNDGAGGDIGGEEQFNVRLSALWTPTDNLEALLRYTRIENEGELPGIFAAENICSPVNSTGATDAAGLLLDCTNFYGGAKTEKAFRTPYLVEHDDTPRRDYLEDNVTLDVTWAINNSLSAHVITSWTDFENKSYHDGDTSPTPGYPQYFDEENESITFEANLSYTGGPLTGTLGAYWSNDEFGYGYSEAPFGNFSYCGGDACIYADFQEIDITTKAVYLQLEFAVNDDVRLLAGVRRNEEEKDTDSFWTFTQFDENGDPLPGVNTVSPFEPIGRPRDVLNYDLRPTTVFTQDFDITTWKAGVEWDISDNAMVYANIGTGYLSGGVNGDGTKFGEQENEALEVGFKSRWADNTVQFNAAAYKNEGTDLTTQLGQFIDNVFVTSTVNGGEVETIGVEAELVWLLDQWTISANVSLMDSEHKVYSIDKGFAEYGGSDLAETGGLIDLKGTTPPWAADATLSISVSYDIDLGSMGRLTPFLQFFHSSEYNTDDLVTYPGQVQGAYHKTDLRLFWTSASAEFGVEAFVENVEDEAVLGRTNRSGSNVETSYLFPRTYGVRVSYNFH